MSDKQFLEWLIDRLIHVYGESPNVDFIHRLRSIGNKIEFLEKHNWKLSK